MQEAWSSAKALLPARANGAGQPLILAAAATGIVAPNPHLGGAIDSIFLPSVDTGHFSLNYELPPGTGLEETSRVGRLLGREVEGLREIESYVLTVGDTGALNARHREL